jgi:hypothetical protein
VVLAGKSSCMAMAAMQQVALARDELHTGGDSSC